MIEKEELFTVIPHRGKMLLLSRVTEYNLSEQHLQAEYDITEDCLFYDRAADGVPVWAGFECMAQAISALVGIKIRENGEEPKAGFILSVSSMRIHLPFFKTGSTVKIQVREAGRIDSVYVFEGEIVLENKTALEGKLAVMDAGDEMLNAMMGRL